MARKLIVEIVGDASSLEKSYRKAEQGTKRFGQQMSNTGRGTVTATAGLKGMGRSVAGLSAAFLGGAGLVAAAHAAIGEFSEAAKVSAQTEAALKSTGSAAGVTATYIDELAKSVSGYSGQDDEAVQAGENLLLTFTQIRDAAGKNNDIFTQATKAAADLSQAMGIDMTNAALQVGKALNDPARGYARLQRIGVAFTAAQVEQIKGFAKLGQVQNAQRVILAELTKEFGGSAKAFGETLPGKIARLRESLMNLSGEIVGTLAPSFERLTDRALKWVQNSENQKRVLDGVRSAAKTAGDVIRRLAGIVQEINDALGGWRNTLTILVGAWAGFKVAAITSTTAILVANQFAAKGVSAAWRTALIATGWGVVAVAAGVAASFIITHWEKVKTWFTQFWLWLKFEANRAALAVVEPFSHLPTFLGGWARDAKQNLQETLGEIELQFAAAGESSGTSFNKGVVTGMAAAPPVTPAAGDDPLAAITGGKAGKGPTAAEKTSRRNQWFDAMISRQLGRVQDITSLKGQFGRLHEIAALIRGRMAATTDITRYLTLEDRLLDVYRQQRGINVSLSDMIEQRAADSKEAAAAAKEKAKADRETAAALRESRQYLALGFTGEGLEKIPGAKALRGAAERLGAALKGTILDTGGNQGMLKRIRDVLSGRLGEISRTMRERVQQMIQDLRQQLDSLDKKKPGRRRGRFDAEGNLIGGGLVGIPNERHVPSVINRFTGAVEEATVALSSLDKLRIFADLRQFGGNLWSRAGAAAIGAGGSPMSRLTPLPTIGRGTGQTGMPGIFGGGGRHLSGGVVVNQHFNAPTTDRHREARYAMMATRAVFDS